MENKINKKKIYIFIGLLVLVLVIVKIIGPIKEKAVDPENYIRSVSIDTDVLLNEERKIEDSQNRINLMKKDIFETVQEIHFIKQNVRDVFVDNENSDAMRSYEGLNTIMAIDSNIIPETLIAEQVKDEEIKPWGSLAINRFGGLVTVDSVGERFNHRYFKVTYSGLPNYMCETLLLADWDKDYIGAKWIGANGKYFSKGEKVSKEDAMNICVDGGYFQVGFE